MTTTTYSQQDIWNIVDALKPSDKAKITKGDNKLRHEMAERNRPFQQIVREKMDMYAPSRDAIIDKAKADYDEAVRIAEDKYRTIREVAQAEFTAKTKAVIEIQNVEWKKNYDLYHAEWKALISQVSGQYIG